MCIICSTLRCGLLDACPGDTWLPPNQTWSSAEAEVWVKELSGDRVAVMLFNPTSHAHDITLDFARDLPMLAKEWAREVKDTTPAWCDAFVFAQKYGWQFLAVLAMRLLGVLLHLKTGGYFLVCGSPHLY